MISQEEENKIEAMGWTVTCQSPMEMEHTDGSTVTGANTCSIIIKDVIEEYHEMKKGEAIEADRAEKASATASLNLENINGSEILDFLNDALENDDDLCDISPDGPFEFEGQCIEEGEYKLYFTAYYNNWGTDQAQEGQVIKIGPEGVVVWLGEAFEGDGSDEAMEEAITKWLKTHKFKSNDEIETKFKGMIDFSRNTLGMVTFDNKELVDKVIAELTEAKSYMK